MLKKYIVLLVLISALVHIARAQDKDKKVKLQSISNIGLLSGSKTSSFALQTVLGGSYKNIFLGLGAGLDYYRFRSVPVFADLRYEFGKGKRNLFFYGDMGYNFDWVNDKNKEQANMYFVNGNFKGGLYYDAGVGYKFGFKNSDALLFSAGYTFKKLKNEVTEPAFCPFIGPCTNDADTYKYYLSRLVIKVGWRF